jgi:Transposase IS116/IS110/IS902 family
MAAAKVESRALAWVGVAQAAVELYGDDGAMPYDDVAAELATEVRLLRALLAEQKPHQQARERAYLRVEPDELARTLPGIAEVGAPLLVAAIGRAQRFASAAKFKAFTGLTPRASETGETDRKGQAITKAGAARLRKQLICSANTARQIDPQLAAVYYAQMVERGAHHIKALCIVAAKLAERFWGAVQASGEPYVLRDVDGREVSIEQARRIIATRYTVPEEVRRRRRSSKPRGGKAPQQVLSGHAQRGTSRAEPGRPSPRRSSPPPMARSTG